MPLDENWLRERRADLARVSLRPFAEAVGRVERVADGVAYLTGLSEARLNEQLRFEGGALGFVMALEADALAAVLLDPAESIEAGMEARACGQFVDTPVGDGLLGRIIDPLGRPLDGGGPLQSSGRWPVERPAPEIIDRDLVSAPLETGVLAVDAMFAIGRGQRELIIGDRATGKTSLALEAILNQRNGDVVSVYVAIGQRSSSTERVIKAIREHGDFNRCVVIVAPASAPAALQWIAPFAAMTIAEYFRDAGRDALVVLDDLTKHAAIHREISLLTREPPGREAYPGDLFYLHARLLERAAKLSSALGGGSVTALPIAETDAGNLSAYIPTNLISITDGQIVLDARLFASNHRPAIDIGLSVSRVGGKAQAHALRDVAGRLRLEYAQFLELELFTRFGGLSDARVASQIARGQRIRAALIQPRFEALGRAEQVALIAAIESGAFDAAAADSVARVRPRLAEALTRVPEIKQRILADERIDQASQQTLADEVVALAREAAP